MSATLSSTQIQSKVANIHGNKIFSNLEEMLISNIWKLFLESFCLKWKVNFTWNVKLYKCKFSSQDVTNARKYISPQRHTCSATKFAIEDQIGGHSRFHCCIDPSPLPCLVAKSSSLLLTNFVQIGFIKVVRWICQNWYMDFSESLDGCVKIDTWISLSYSMDS